MPQDNDATTEDDLLSDVIPQNIQHEQLPRKDFMPWHRPRKQWVRVKQWKQETLRLVDAIKLTDRPLTYLSLPGDDLLDIRVIYEACERKQVKLRFLGFNNPIGSGIAVDAERSLSIAEVISLPLVDDNSIVVRDRLESIANKKSLGFKWVRDYGTFDVINIDLCDSISAPSQRRGNGPTYYDALFYLLEHQVKTRTSPWLFFLTTRCGNGDVHPEDVESLYSCIRSNVKMSETFCAIMADLFGLDNFDESSLTTVKERTGFPEFMQMFSIGFGKWLLQAMMKGIPPSKVKMLTSYHYQVMEPGDMISVAYRFDPMPQPPIDPVGLTSKSTSSPETLHIIETQLAVTIVERTKALVDVDDTLGASPNEMENMIASTEALLSNARYPVDRYRGWLSSTSSNE